MAELAKKLCPERTLRHTRAAFPDETDALTDRQASRPEPFFSAGGFGACSFSSLDRLASNYTTVLYTYCIHCTYSPYSIHKTLCTVLYCTVLCTVLYCTVSR